MPRLAPAALAVVLLTLAAAAAVVVWPDQGAEAQPTGRKTINGVVRVTGIYPTAEFAAVGDPCDEDPSGSIVRITNGSNVLVGRGRVGDGMVVAVAVAERSASGGARQSQDCELPFSVPDLPAVDLYVLYFGESWQGAYTFDDLEAMGWEIHLTFA